MTCSIDGCTDPVKARGWCTRHYNAWIRHGDSTRPVRAYRKGVTGYEKVMAQLAAVPCRYPHLGDCQEFTGGRVTAGYGQVNDGGTDQYAHRLVWQHHNGSIPKGLFVCHHCDNPACCEITHLYLGSQAENVSDMMTRARGKNGRPYLTPTEVRAIRADKRLLREIAAEYGISTTTVSDIRTRKRWASV